MQSEKVKIYCKGDDKDNLIYQAIVRRNGVTIKSVQFNHQDGEWVQKGQELGKIICSDDTEKIIKVNLTGTIDNICKDIKLDAPSFSLCNINLCGHDDLIQTDLMHMHICSKCQEQVWLYRDKTAGVIVATKFSDFISNKRINCKDDEYEIKFSQIKKNELIQPMVLLFEAEQSSHNSDSDSDDEGEKIEFKMKEVIYIKDINYNYNQDRSWILKYEKVICSHQVIDKTNTCTYCQLYLPEHSNQTYVGLDQKENKLQIGKEYAEYSKKMAHQQLHQNQKLILVLDLDNTILHAVPAMKEATFDIPEGVQKDTFHEFHNRYNKYAIKFRPYMKEFLQTVLPHYEIYIFTMAIYDYAKSICDYLKETYKDILVDYPKTFGQDRIISREQFNSSDKNLQQILPNSEKIMLILDDREDVWTKNSKNLVTTLPYIYWWDGSDSFNEQAYKAIDQLLSYRYKFFKNIKKFLQPQPAQASSNTQANTDAISMYSSLPLIDDQNAQPQTKVEQVQNGDTDKEQISQPEIQKQGDNKQTNGEDNLQNKEQEKDQNEREEKMDVEQINQEFDELSKNTNIFDIQFQTNDLSQSEEQSKSTSLGKKDEQTNGSKLFINIADETVKYPPVIQLEEKEFRPKYKDNIVKKYDNKKFLDSNSILKYKLFVIKQTDNYFLFAAPILVNLKNKYYEEEQEEKRDIREVYSQYTTSILSGVKIAISSILKRDKNETIENNIICKRYTKMGGNIVEKYSNGNEIDYLVIGHAPRKEKLKKAFDNNIPIISYKWIEYSWYYNYKLDISTFEVNKTDFTFKKNDQQIQQELFDKYTKLIFT